MTTPSRLLFDPLLVIPTIEDDLLDFWLDFLDWTEDERLSVGQYSHSYIIEWCTSTIWSNDFTLVPSHLVRDINRTITQLLSRTPIEHNANLYSHETVPAYVSDQPMLVNSFMSDIAGGFASHKVSGVASNPRFWEFPNETLDIVDGETGIELVYNRDQILLSDSRAQVISFYEDQKIIIIGGKKHPVIIRQIALECGIPESRIDWIESEPNKPPRDLAIKLKNFNGISCQLIFIYGRIDHASFHHVQTASQRCGYTLIQPQYESQIVSKLSERAIECS